MKTKLKGIIIGVVIGSLFAVTSVFAAVGGVQKILEYNNIKINLDGQEITPSDVNGNYVEPFIIDGTTYLPVRAVANALGLDVEWDGTTNSVLLSTHKEVEQTEGLSAQKQYPDVTVYESEVHDIKIIYTGVNEDAYTTSVNFMIQYGSVGELEVVIDEVEVNGKDIDADVIGKTLTRENNKINNKTELVIFNDELSESNIESAESIEFEIKVKPAGSDESVKPVFKTGKINLIRIPESKNGDGFDVTVED